MAADSVGVGGAYGSSNERTAAHCRVLLEWGETVYLSGAQLVDFIRDRSGVWVTCLCAANLRVAEFGTLFLDIVDSFARAMEMATGSGRLPAAGRQV